MVAAVSERDVFSCENLAIDFVGAGGIHTVLEDVSFTAQAGQFISIIGASGTGKTTLLRILAGLSSPRAGSTVRFQGNDVTAPPEGVVFVFQDYRGSLLPWRSVLGNVTLGLEGGGMSRSDRVAKANAALKLVGLADRGADYPWKLSGGMQQRVQIARSLAMKPEVLLMDEPFGALDSMTKSSLQDQLADLHQVTGTTILFVTHDIEEAVYLSDRVIVLGGTPAHVTTDIQIALPRPRTQVETRETPEFLEYRHEIYRSIGKG